MIVEYHNFLTNEECEILISIGESSQLNVGVTLGTKIGYRKAKVTWLESEPIIKSIRSKISEITKTDLDKQEKLHFVRYIKGGEYKEHKDGLSRIKTALIYLNNEFTGGETYFPIVGRTIKPETGKLVVWDNLDINGNENPDSLHAGLPVEFGTKYIAVIWIKK